MNYLPTATVKYKTKLSEEEIIQRLSKIIEPEKTFRISLFSNGSTKPYKGSINGNSFEINRIINYSNSFLPQITGIIEKAGEGLTITVKMKLSIFVIVFLSIWFGLVGLACIAVLFVILSGTIFNPMILIPFGMFIFAYLLTMGGFHFESNKSKKDLRQLFDAEIVI